MATHEADTIDLHAPRNDSPGRLESGRGMGDFVENSLRAMGITEDRYKEVKRMFGLPPTCNCSKRKAWLNRVGQHFNGKR